MVIRWVILVGCLFLISCAGEGVKDVIVKSLLDAGEGD